MYYLKKALGRDKIYFILVSISILERGTLKMIKNKGHQHTGMPVKDAKAAAEWYIENLGFTMKGFFTEGTTDLAFVEKDGYVIEFIAPQEGPLREAILNGECDSIHHVAFEVEDVEKAHEEALALGYNITVPITQNSIFENGTKYFMGTTPDGQLLEFSQML